MSKGENPEEAFLDFSTILIETLGNYFEHIKKPVLKNIKEIVLALVLFLRTPRGWNGRMTIMGIARCMHIKGKTKSHYKRLDRFLMNTSFKVHKTAQSLYALIEHPTIGGMIPVVIDQTDIGGVQVITASIPYQGRALPFAITTFEYENIRYSQNKTERDLFMMVQKSIRKATSAVVIMDRGYAQYDYFSFFNKTEQMYVIRACSNVMIEYTYRGKPRRISLGRLRYTQGKAVRYSNVRYHHKHRVPVDIVVYSEKGFKEPWFLIVPPGTEATLSSATVVKLYRSRMNIEVNFRDFKSMLGLRGLKLKVCRAEKLARLLICIALTYILLLRLGSCDLAQQFRKDIEVLRSCKRHGTRRTLSVLTIAYLMTSDSYLLTVTNLLILLTDIIATSFST